MNELPRKVLEYESFVNETLRHDLMKLTKLRDKCFDDIAQYSQLQTLLEKQLIGKNKEVKTKIDLGCNFYAQAIVPDSSMICVCVGYGFFVQFTPEEALRFISKKSALLQETASKLSKDMASVRAQIQFVLQGLRELQGIPEDTKTT